MAEKSRDQGRKPSRITGPPRRNKDDKDDLDYGGSHYDNAQHDSGQYDSGQYDNDQYDSAQYDYEARREFHKRAIDEEEAARSRTADESNEQKRSTYLKDMKNYEDTERRGWTAVKAGEGQRPQPGFARWVFFP